MVFPAVGIIALACIVSVITWNHDSFKEAVTVHIVAITMFSGFHCLGFYSDYHQKKRYLSTLGYAYYLTDDDGEYEFKKR